MNDRRFKYHVFLSHNGAQKDWTRRLAVRLREAGLSVFFDEDSISLGEDLSAAIEDGLRSSRHVLLVLSPESLASSWVALEYSASLYKDPSAANRSLIPILRCDCDEIPLILGRLKHLDARGDDFERQVEHLLNAIDRVKVVTPQKVGHNKQRVSTEKDIQVSSDAVKLLTIGMPLRPDAEALYVERQADLEARWAVETNSLLVISGPRRVGKTSLLLRMRAFAESIGRKPAFIDLQMFGGGPSGPQLYYELSLRLSEELDAQEPDAKSFLRAPGRAFLDFLDGLVGSSVILIDEYDMLRGLGILEEFSTVLRAFQSQKAWKNAEPAGILIASWLPPYRFIENTMASPFNIGNHVRLGAFDRREAESMIRRVIPAMPVRDADSLFEFVGGQPFLLGSALYWLTQGRAVDELARVATRSDGPFGTYLQSLGHSVSEDVRRALERDELSKLAPSELAHLEEVGILRRLRSGYEWAGGLHKAAFGNAE